MSRRTLRSFAPGKPACLGFEPLEPRQLLAVTNLVAEADTYTQSGVGAGDAAVLDTLDANGPGDRVTYVRFDVSGIDFDAYESVSLNLFKTAGARNDTIITGRFDVYGLLDMAGNTPQDWDEATLAEGGVGLEYTAVGGDGLDVSRLFNLDEESGADVTEVVENVDGAAQSISGPDLIAFLESRQADDGLATFVTYVDAGNYRGWGYGSRENADPAMRPVLTLDDGQPPGHDDAYPEDPVVFPRQVEYLNRGVVAVRPSGSTVYVGWRLLGTDPADVAFRIYRSTDGGAPVPLQRGAITQTTDFVDDTADLTRDNTYYVAPVIDGVEQPLSEGYTLGAFATIEQHLTIPLVIPPGGQTPSGEDYTYSANDATVGDLDGDGQYEVILKWDPSNSKDNSQSGYTGNVYVDAYTLEGELLWRIDLGHNVRAGAHYTQMVVYDLDGDGRSEVVLKTAPGTVDGQGNDVLLNRDSPAADYRNSSGYVLTGPEYLTVFDGLSGAELQSIPFPLERISASTWGDSYGNRVDRFLSGVAYLDGERPSIVWARGYYGPQSGFQARNEVVALDWRGGELTQRWRFNAATNGANPEYIAQGSNALVIADVDGDGYDEIIHGGSALDHDGTGLYSTGLGHGDAIHVSDLDPSNPGLEVFMVHESPSAYESEGRDAGGELRDAQTGELLFQIPSNNDVGRGVAADIDPNHVGYEFWATTNEGTRRIYNVSGEALYDTPGNMMYNFAVWWDADLSRELLDGTTISEWNNPGRSNLVSFGNSGINSTAGLSSSNGSKSTPSLVADLFGDWREEVIWRRSDSTALEIWTTTIAATSRLPTLMHDTHYRSSVAGQNVAYNQPSHPGYWIGEGMDPAPLPPLYFGGGLEGDYNADGLVNAADYSVWRDTLGSTDSLAADGSRNGVVDQADYDLWRSNYGATAAAPVAFAETPSAVTALAAAASAAAAAEAAPVAQSIQSPTPLQAAFAIAIEEIDEAEGADTPAISTPAPAASPLGDLLLYDADPDARPAKRLSVESAADADSEPEEPADELFALLDADESAWLEW
ncbi:Rhamnogalacturonan endolyase YesW precursor [Posidoniimonas corsicana]|uniref:Rhamnogalacturonan endolyase YesW n=1 Tax=Posidoniimonas corsicana TaxID=1938618 RepID=A0A5C5VGD2_9BACT|nr:rhamnogalacturonan lyase [Posidoniimonas corsicana]TWT37626.1 Rhamnogalacturonan endolyase YesW precursor [Posidoniimonas corsicana]